MISSAYFSLLHSKAPENKPDSIFSEAKPSNTQLFCEEENAVGPLENLKKSHMPGGYMENKFSQQNIFPGISGKRRDSGFSEDNSIFTPGFSTGILDEHYEGLSTYSQKHDLIIGLRGVEPAAKSLIAEGIFPSKGLHIKAKSSNCGPTAGFIPVLLKYSKSATANNLSENALLNSLSQFIYASIHPALAVSMRGWLERGMNVLGTFFEDQKQEGIAVLLADKKVGKIHLKLRDERLNELISSGLIKIEDNIKLIEEGYFVVSSVGINNKINYFKISKVADEDGYAIYDESGKNVEVLADVETKKPFIPDYDLLFVSPSIEQMNELDNMINALDLKNNPTINNHYSSETSEFGNTTPRSIKKVIPGLNKALKRGLGTELIRHGADEGNPASKPESIYPATIFLPKLIDGLGPGLVFIVKNHDDLFKVIKEGANAGYCFKVNPLWDGPEGRLGKIRRESFINAKEELEPKLKDVFNKRLPTRRL